jgi:2-keto-3-deoxy-L-rhamnonate aldolase RhmA
MIIGCVLIGEGDLSQELGVPRQYEHPIVKDAMANIVSMQEEQSPGRPPPRHH